MKIKSKKIFCAFLVFFVSVITIIIANEKVSFSANDRETNNLGIAYVDFASEEYQRNFEKVLEDEYGTNYKQIIAQNKAATVTANQINEMLVSSETNELEYPNYIGGLYIDDNNELIVQIKKSETPLIKTKSYSNYNSIVTNKELNIENVDYSYNELEAIYELLNNSDIKSSIYNNITVYYIDVINNCVVIELLDNSVVKQNEFKQEVIDSNIIEFKQGTLSELEAYNTGQGTHNCTIGFRAKLGNVTGFVTAGHCASNLSIGDSYSTYGTLKAYQQGGKVDAAFIQTSTTINRTLQYPVYPVNSLASTAGYVPNLVVGTLVGKSGRTTGGTSGKVTSLNATWNGQNASTEDGAIRITDMIQADYNSDGGDSGSPVFTITGGTLIGVHRGSIGKLKYSSNYNNIKASLGVTIY